MSYRSKKVPVGGQFASFRSRPPKKVSVGGQFASFRSRPPTLCQLFVSLDLENQPRKISVSRSERPEWSRLSYQAPRAACTWLDRMGRR